MFPTACGVFAASTTARSVVPLRPQSSANLQSPAQASPAELGKKKSNGFGKENHRILGTPGQRRPPPARSRLLYKPPPPLRPRSLSLPWGVPGFGPAFLLCFVPAAALPSPPGPVGVGGDPVLPPRAGDSQTLASLSAHVACFMYYRPHTRACTDRSRPQALPCQVHRRLIRHCQGEYQLGERTYFHSLARVRRRSVPGLPSP